MSIASYLNKVFVETNDMVHENMIQVSPEELGLDGRAGFQLFVDKEENWIGVLTGSDNSLQYYGGFEYIDKEYRETCGAFVFYSAEADRVRECLDHYFQNNPQDEEVTSTVD